MVGGFHIAALVRRGWQQDAERLLVRLAEANRQGSRSDWEFNEWLHGETGHPMGYAHQAWSAAMFLYAEHAVKTGRLPLFDDLLAAKPKSRGCRDQRTLYPPRRWSGGVGSFYQHPLCCRAKEVPYSNH